MKKMPNIEDTKIKNRAVALQYAPNSKTVPKVVASGKGLMAEKIIEVAQENNIYVHENPELVSFLAELDVGEEIPENLYKAIAEVIAFAYRLKEQDSLAYHEADATLHQKD